jgi:hypothetical protein
LPLSISVNSQARAGAFAKRGLAIISRTSRHCVGRLFHSTKGPNK